MNHAKAANERGHFFNDNQKKVKAKIMAELMAALFGNMKDNEECFSDLQSILDLIFSILVMFNREVLVHTIKEMQLEHDTQKIIDNLFATIKDQVLHTIGENK